VSLPSPLFPRPQLPKPGHRLDLTLPSGSADALFIAELASAQRGRLLTLITARAADAQRLIEEIADIRREVGEQGRRWIEQGKTCYSASWADLMEFRANGNR
jgi:hypothetical protein